ncbi:MAG: hypothetical protein SOW66_01335 [Porphyromonas sp.]|nr:hypothetical protein [Porphyromonas sp.]
MNTTALHSFSWGRTWLMLRASLIADKIALLSGLCGAALTRYMALYTDLLTSNNRALTLEILATDYDYTRELFALLVAGWMMWLFFLRQRTVKGSPLTFSTLPANTREKAASLLIYGLGILILVITLSLITFSLHWLTLPGELASTPAKLFSAIGDKLQELASMSSDKEALPVSLAVAGTIGIIGFLLVAPVYACIRIQNDALAMAAALAGPLLLTGALILFALNIHGFGDYANSTNMSDEEIANNITQALLIFNLALWAMVGLLSVLSWRRLQTIPT